MKRNVSGRGKLILHTRYKLVASLNRTFQGEITEIVRQSRRFFVAKKPYNPRQNFIEQAQAEIFFTCNFCSQGYSMMQAKFERNYYLPDEELKLFIKINNQRCKDDISFTTIKLIRNVKANGQGGRVFTENSMVVQRIYEGFPGRSSTKGFERSMSLFFDDVNAKFLHQRKKKQKEWRQEDLKFAEAFQPSTIGHIYSCLYTVVVNRGFKGCFNYPTGLSSLITINPSEQQVNGFEYVVPPVGWDPMVVDCRSGVSHQYPIQKASDL